MFIPIDGAQENRSIDVNRAAAEIKRQFSASKEIKTQEAVDSSRRRQRVRHNCKAFSMLAERFNPAYGQTRHILDAARSGHGLTISGSGGVVAKRHEDAGSQGSCRGARIKS